MKERKLTYRQLAERIAAADPEGKGLTYGYLNDLVIDQETPSVRAMQLIAAGLEVSPRQFVEYQNAAIRRAFDEEALGFGQVLAHRETLHRLLNESQPGDELTLGLLALIEDRASDAEWLEPPLGPVS